MNDNPAPIGISVIGCGAWGQNYVRVFSELPESHVVVACDAQPERLEQVKRRYPAVQTTTHVDEALALSSLDAAVVSTNATSHYRLAGECLAAGKHVLVEKPITTEAEHASSLQEQADTAGLTLMVGHTFLFNPAVWKVKEYISGPEMGDVHYLYARRTNLGPIRNDVNALWDLAPHDISVFNHLLGSQPEWVSATGARLLNNDCYDVGFVTLCYPGNVLANVHVSWVDPDKVREMVVVGSNMRIVFDDLNFREQVRVFERGVAFAPQDEADDSATYHAHRFAIRDGDIVSPRILPSEPLKNQGQHFLECIRNETRPLTDGLSGLEVVKVMKAIDRSVELRGVPILVESRDPISACGGKTAAFPSSELAEATAD